MLNFIWQGYKILFFMRVQYSGLFFRYKTTIKKMCVTRSKEKS